jgi:hypothetical protein
MSRRQLHEMTGYLLVVFASACLMAFVPRCFGEALVASVGHSSQR